MNREDEKIDRAVDQLLNEEEPKKAAVNVYTVLAMFPDGGYEELDVWANSKSEAKTLAREELKKSYQPGGQVIRVKGPRFGLYL